MSTPLKLESGSIRGEKAFDLTAFVECRSAGPAFSYSMSITTTAGCLEIFHISWKPGWDRNPCCLVSGAREIMQKEIPVI